MRVQPFIHESIPADRPVFWIFDDSNEQIGSVVCEGDQWRGTKMLRGMPTAQRMCATQEEAQAFASSEFGKVA